MMVLKKSREIWAVVLFLYVVLVNVFFFFFKYLVKQPVKLFLHLVYYFCAKYIRYTKYKNRYTNYFSTYFLKINKNFRGPKIRSFSQQALLKSTPKNTFELKKTFIYPFPLEQENIYIYIFFNVKMNFSFSFLEKT